MKPIDSSGHRPLLIGAAAFILLVVTGAFLKGARDGRDDAGRNDPLGHRKASLGGDSDQDKSLSENHVTESTEKLHQRLWKIWNASPDFNQDPEAQASMADLIAQMSSPQIEDFLRSLPPGSERGGIWIFRRTILLNWVLQDGPAALAYLENSLPPGATLNQMDTTQMVMVWTAEQPDAALAWMEDPDLPPGQKRRANNLRLNSLMMLMDTNPDRAFQELSRMEPDAVSNQLRLWAGTNGSDPQIQQRLLDYTASQGSSEDLQQVRSTLLQGLAEKDMESAKKLMESFEPNEAEKSAFEIALTLARAKKEPEATFDGWVATNDVSQGIPESIRKGIGSWMWTDPDGVVRWLDKQAAGEKRDAIYAGSISALIGFGNIDKAAEIATTIESPALRAQALHDVNLRWSQVNQEAGDRWKAMLPVADRELLEK